MDILNRANLQELIEASGNRCVSIYMPAHPVGAEQQQNPIRLRNLLTQAKKDLLAYGLRRPEADALFRPGEDLLLDPDFWQHQGEGLAVFLSNDFARFYRLPVKFNELLTIENNFHINPLLPLLSTEGRYYILAINLNGIRLFLATRDTISEVELPGVPTDIEEALWMDEPERQLNFHITGNTAGRGKAGGRPGVFHGHGIRDEDKTNILRFFHYFDQELNTRLEEKSILMLPAGMDYLIPLYREANTYNNLLSQAWIGAPEKLSIKELHKHAWEIMEPIFKERQMHAIEQFKELNGQQSELVTTALSKVVKAAKFGQVGTLFVPLGLQKWGRYNPADNTVVQESESTPENEDLLDFAAMHTILNGGQVYALQPEELPGDGEIAAILRYPVQENLLP
ncbi:MAG TPA: hypothetical protein VJ821_03520 [Anaerolineales bacterium]|nr:hypothetical protein [Anaerolineales bacterium]